MGDGPFVQEFLRASDRLRPFCWGGVDCVQKTLGTVTTPPQNGLSF